MQNYTTVINCKENGELPLEIYAFRKHCGTHDLVQIRMEIKSHASVSHELDDKSHR